MKEFSVFLLLQGITPVNKWIVGLLFKGLQSHMENKNKGNENKTIL